MPQTLETIPSGLANLHVYEESLRKKALGLVAGSDQLKLHLAVTEAAMDLADVLRKFDTDNEDMKVIQILGMRAFNAFGASIKLALSGYSQNGALIMRDVLETVFLIDYFGGDRSLIERWRLADKKARMKDFAPVKVREALDLRDGFVGKKRYEVYEMFSELAGHPTMQSDYMMRPQPDSDATIGPFMEGTMLEAVVSEMGRLAVQAGEQLSRFFPIVTSQSVPSCIAFANLKRDWIATFYLTDANPTPATTN